MSQLNTFTVKFAEFVPIEGQLMQKITGTAKARSLVPLLSMKDVLAPNPRLPKIHSVTYSIMESIQNSPSLFQFKSKGILLGSTEYRELDRKRFVVSFNDIVEGLQDGGHNLLGLGMHILEHEAEFMPSDLKKIRRWEDFQEFWFANESAILTAIRANVENDVSTLDFSFPLELLVPIRELDEIEEREYMDSLLSICAARNNNSELTNETVNNRQGIYEQHKKAMPKYGDDVEWRTNDGGRIKVRDVVSVTWVALQKLDLPIKHGVTSVKIYSSKGDCSKQFGLLMKHKDVSSAEAGSIFELKNPGVGSAIAMSERLMDLFDLIYEKFPIAYNKVGSFGKIKPVRWYADGDSENPKTLKRQPVTPYGQRPVKYSYPPAFIYPIFCGLKALMMVDGNKIIWEVEPEEFIEDHLEEVVKTLKSLMEVAHYDPQTIGKMSAAYSLIEREIENVVSRNYE